MKFQDMLVLVKKHQNDGEMISSAQLCIQDAERAYKAGAFESAKKWALKSLSYSVGVFHPDYIAAKGDPEKLEELLSKFEFGWNKLSSFELDLIRTFVKRHCILK